LATALTALNIYPLDEQVTVKKTYSEGKVMDLVLNERLTVKSLLSALLVYSANDSAFTLASHHPNGIPGFIDQMNILAKRYYLTDTHFVNFDGIHDPNHYSSVYDLAQLGRVSTRNPFVQAMVKNKNIVVTDLDNKYVHNLTTTNELLGVVPEIEGLKTGWTPEAGGCFVGEINLNGHHLISVVAQSADRFADTTQIVAWAKQNIIWNSYSP
jgi:D-alanyl-D-alanine carboxypeptidase (penicillin-binding protein 5/6)